MSKTAKRGRPRDEKRKIAIARAVILHLIPEEAAILQGLARRRFGRWTTKPKTKAAYAAVAEEFGVSVDYVGRIASTHRGRASRAIGDELAKRLDASDRAEQVERRSKIARMNRERGVRFSCENKEVDDLTE